MAIPSLTGSYIDETFQRLVQTNDTRTEFADGLGNPITLGPPGSVNPTPTYLPYNKAGAFQDSFLRQYNDVLQTTSASINRGLQLGINNANYILGDYDNTNNKTLIQVNDDELTIALHASNSVYVGDNDNSSWLFKNQYKNSGYWDASIIGFFDSNNNNIITYQSSSDGIYNQIVVGDRDNNQSELILGKNSLVLTTSTGSILDFNTFVGLEIFNLSNRRQTIIGDSEDTYNKTKLIVDDIAKTVTVTGSLKVLGGADYSIPIAKFTNAAGNEIQILVTDEASSAGYVAPIGSIGNYQDGLNLKYGGNDNDWGKFVANISKNSATHVPFFKSDNTLSTSSLYQSGSSTIIINQNAATSAAPEALYVWQPINTDNGFNVISGKGNLNNYLQLNIHNTNPGINASSDVVATANNGDENGNYIDMGINSNGFNGSLGRPNDAYLYSTGSDLHIGNATPNKPVQFFAGGINTDTNRKFQLNANNQHNMTGSLDISGSLAIRNLVTSSVSNVLTYNPSTGQVYYTASSAIGGGGSGNPVAILDEGSTLTSAVTSINFTGAGVAATNVGNAVTVTINGTSIDTSAFATTGSNTFRGNQIVTGSLFTTGSNTLIGTTTLTGSLNITGSTTQIGNNNLYGNTILSGSIIISGALGTNNPTVKVYGDTQHNGYIRFDPVTTNIDTSISASYIYVSGSTQDLYFSQNGNGYNNVTRLRWLEGALYTGILRGGNMTSTPGSNTFTVASGSGIIVTMNASLASEPYPTVKQVSWPTQTLPITYSGSAKITYVGISNTGTVTQQTEAWGSTNINQWDTAISLGVILTLSGSVSTGVFNAPQIGYGGFQKTDDFIRAFGPLKISGHTLLASGSTLGIKKAGGSSYREGANYVIDPNHPSTVIESAINTSKIYRYYLSGSTPVIDTGEASAGYTVIDPTKYVDTTTGNLTPVYGNNSNQWYWTIQRVFWVPNSPTNAFIVYYGNAQYATLLDAKNGIDTEPFSEAPNTALNSILVGYILVRKGCTDLSDTTGTNAVLVQGGLFRSVGGVGGSGTSTATTLGSLSDVALANLSKGDLLVYDAQGGSQWNNAKQLNGSYGLTGSLVVTQNISASSFTGSLFGTASWASNVVTASYITSSFFTGTNAALSASYASTASYVVTAQTASYVTSSNIVGTVLSSSYAATASLLLGTVANATNATNASSGSDFVITSTLRLDKTLVDYGEQLNTSTGTYPLFDFATGSFTSAHGKYTLFNGTNARAGEFITVWNGTNINYTDVSTTDLGSTSDISLQSTIVANRIQINAVTLSSGWTVKMLATFI